MYTSLVPKVPRLGTNKEAPLTHSHNRSICAEDLYRFRLISDPRISSDGRLAVYVQHRVDGETQKKHANLWLVPVDGGPPRRFTQGDHADVSPELSPGGDQIAFLSNRADENQKQLYLIPIAGGEARKLTNFKGAIQSFCWSPDGTKLLVQFRAKDPETIEREEAEKKKDLGVVSRRVTRLFYKLDGTGFLPDERIHLWLVDAQTGESTQLTSGEVHDEWNPTWSPDGATIAYCSNRTPDPDLHPAAIDLLVREMRGGDERKIEAPFGRKSLPSFSPDGRWIAYLGSEGDDPWALTRLWIAPIDDSAEARCLTKEHDFNVSASTINDMGSVPQMRPTWSVDGSRLYIQVAHHGRTTLKAVDLDGTVTDVINEPGVVGPFTFDEAQRRLLYFFATLTDPGQILVREGIDGDTCVLTHANQKLLAKIDLGRIEEMWFKGSAGNDLQGWILTPPGFDPNMRYPSILEVHGGPQTQYGHLFMHEFFFLAAQGYVVYFCNPRGGQGYGDAHCRAIANNWGTVDYEDLMAWADVVAAKPYIDAERMGVTGGSYGGYMTNWIISHTDRFNAAVTQRCVSNLISMWGSSDFNWVFQRLFGDHPPWESHDSFWQSSPIKHFANVKTPTLVIHSENDMRCSIEQGEQVFVALKLLGVDTEMIRYPDEPHGLSRTGRTDRRIDRLGHIVRWFDRYLK
jgi:dipeptidyl aminopeptidase/acylaminoacyl peptidase